MPAATNLGISSSFSLVPFMQGRSREADAAQCSGAGSKEQIEEMDHAGLPFASVIILAHMGSR